MDQRAMADMDKANTNRNIELLERSFMMNHVGLVVLAVYC